ncbi:MAG: SagB/ThcOx family dehydrogenase [Thermodesulfobacteriota bacterium]
MRQNLLVAVVCVVFLPGAWLHAFGQDAKPVPLPAPKLDQAKSLAQALTVRKTSREFSVGNLTPQTLSNLLWAAFGINRAESGRRTAPSALNRQELDVYVTTAEGAYLYDPKAHALAPVVSGDIRPLTYTQAYCKDAAVNLVYVADLSKMGDTDEGAKMFLAGADTGFIGQNVYLYCASEGLATVFRASIDKKKLAQALKLRADQRITFAQTVGFPKAHK